MIRFRAAVSGIADALLHGGTGFRFDLAPLPASSLGGLNHVPVAYLNAVICLGTLVFEDQPEKTSPHSEHYSVLDCKLVRRATHATAL